MSGIHWPTSWDEVIALAIIIVCITTVIVEVILIRRLKKARILRLLLCIASAYWAALYVFVYVTIPGSFNPVVFGQIFVRLPFFYTLTLILGLGVYRLFSDDSR